MKPELEVPQLQITTSHTIWSDSNSTSSWKCQRRIAVGLKIWSTEPQSEALRKYFSCVDELRSDVSHMEVEAQQKETLAGQNERIDLVVASGNRRMGERQGSAWNELRSELSREVSEPVSETGRA